MLSQRRNKSVTDYLTTTPAFSNPVADGEAATSRDQHAHYSHELSEGVTDAFSRAISRLVPLIYGAIMGVVSEHLVVGLAVSLLITMVLDLSMGEQSLFRNMARLIAKPALQEAENRHSYFVPRKLGH